MPAATVEELNAMQAQARQNPAAVDCPRCGASMSAIRSIADRYVPHDLLEEAFEGLPKSREWRLLSLDLRCEDCFPSAVVIAL